MIGKRLATTGDLHHTLCNVATLKSLTGGYRQTTDIKFGDAVAFQSNAKIVFAMNGLPSLPPNENINPVAKKQSNIMNLLWEMSNNIKQYIKNE